MGWNGGNGLRLFLSLDRKAKLAEGAILINAKIADHVSHFANLDFSPRATRVFTLWKGRIGFASVRDPIVVWLLPNHRFRRTNHKHRLDLLEKDNPA
ncbi:MAG: hypothetical protein ACREOH_18685 [Candidatus Entotheonellia bacterium]